jgi:hypothetical protein
LRAAQWAEKFNRCVQRTWRSCRDLALHGHHANAAGAVNQQTVKQIRFLAKLKPAQR